MKTIFSFIFFFSLFFFLPTITRAQESKEQLHLSDSYLALHQKQTVAKDDSQFQSVFLDDDDLNDEDEITAAKKKSSYVISDCFGINQNTLLAFKNKRTIKFCSTDFSQVPNFDFYSLRVLRL